MSERRIRRASATSTATVGTSTADASSINVDGMVGGLLTFPDALPTGATTITFYAADDQAGPYRQLFDKDGTAVSVTLTTNAGAAYAMPWEVGDSHAVRLVCNESLGTAATTRVALKG
jgi:hypothetical protein